MRPEEALDEARRRAAAGGPASSPDLPGFAVHPTERVSVEQLLDWAVIEPDLSVVRSTRRHGAPITWVKRGAVHLLRQYLGQVLAQQARFNLQVVAHLAELDDRVTRLERWSSTRP